MTLFDPKQEWDSVHHGTRISIEAISEAQIRKNGKGPDKKIWTSTEEIDGPGPYYDCNSSHVHIWKKGSEIENFTCEQNKSKSYCQITESDITRSYCRICHIKLKRDKVPGIELEDKSIFARDYPSLKRKENCGKPTGESTYNLLEVVEQKRREIEESIVCQEKDLESDLIKKLKRVKDNWYKVVYKLTQQRILYFISRTKSMLIWPWEMTDYQKFKYSNPNYKDSCIFIKSKLEDFQDNYVCIE